MNFISKKMEKNGLRSQCKSCMAEYDKKCYNDNKEKIATKQKEYYDDNKIKIIVRVKEYQKNNKEKIIEYRKNNRSKINKQHKERMKTDINFRLACNLRARLWSALNNNQKRGSAVQDLGCSMEELKAYLELKFDQNMTWENYGKWHIDHIISLASFDLRDYEQVKKACHYTNLQPLWGYR